jgi:chitinase
LRPRLAEQVRFLGRARMACAAAAVLAAVLTAPAALAASSHRESGKQIIAYVFPQTQVLKPGDVDVKKLTRINYAFANIADGKIVEGFPSDGENLATLVALKKENPSLKVLVSVGGWLWSGNFSDMVLTKGSRETFIKSVVGFVEKHQLDGLDVDWEYPGMAGAGNHFRPEDTQNFTLLMKELRDRFDHEQKKLHRRLYLSIAAGAQTDFLEHTEMEKVARELDTVNLMAYDYYEPGSDPNTGHHAPLFTDPSDPKKISADESVKEFEKAGVPAAKIVLGVPFYGHVWGEVGDKNNGLFQPGKPVPNTYSRYGDIAANMLEHGYTRHWDAVASAPYLYNASQHIFVSYDDPESLGLKCRYVLDHKLGGVMFWDYESDPTGTLLKTLHDDLGSEHRQAASGQ